MFDLGKIVENITEGISKVVGGGAGTMNALSAFGNLDASKMQVVQAVMTAVQKVQFPELMELVKKGDFQALIGLIMSSKDSMPDFHKAFTEAGGEKALEAVKAEEAVTTESETVVEKVEDAKDAVVEKAQDMTETVAEKVEDAKDAVVEKAQDMTETVAEKVEDAKDAVVEMTEAPNTEEETK